MSDILKTIAKDRTEDNESVMEQIEVVASTPEAARVLSEMKSYYDNMVDYDVSTEEAATAMGDAFDWVVDKNIMDIAEYNDHVADIVQAKANEKDEGLKKSADEKKFDNYDHVSHRNIGESTGPLHERAKEHHVKEYATTNAPSLSTRYCPDHDGTQFGRISDGIYQCPIDNKVYNFHDGFTDQNGNDYPAGSVSEQTPVTTHYGLSYRVLEDNN